MSELPTIEVAFSPTYGMPHFIASARDARGDFLYELGDDGWRLTMLPDMRIGSGPVHPDVEDALWRGAACLTGTPDLEAVAVPIIPGGALPDHPSFVLGTYEPQPGGWMRPDGTQPGSPEGKGEQ